MNKLHRVKSTDLNVLRSMLNEDVESNEFHNDDIDVGQTINDSKGSLGDIVRLDNGVARDDKKHKMPKMSPHKDRKPFVLTRIESKNRWARGGDVQNIENEPTDSYSARPPGMAVYKSIHYKNIVETETRLERKFGELEKLLSRDVLARTVTLCDKSVNEARQLIQNSLATSRIVSSFLQDFPACRARPQDTHVVQSLGEELLSPPIDIRIDKSFVPPPEAASCSPRIGDLAANLFGMTASSGEIEWATNHSKNNRTDHRLDSDEPFIRQWLKRKNRETRLDRRMKSEQDTIERAIDATAQTVYDQRRMAAEDAFKSWVRTKKPIKQPIRDKSVGESTDSDSPIDPPQAGRMPKPTRNRFIRRPQSLTRPKSSATFQLHTNLKMKVAGHQMSLSMYESGPESSRIHPGMDYPKPPARKDLIQARPQTAVPQSRKPNPASLRNQSQSLGQESQSKPKKLGKKSKKSVVGKYQTNQKKEKQTETTEKQETYSENFSASENEREVEIKVAPQLESVVFNDVKSVEDIRYLARDGICNDEVVSNGSGGLSEDFSGFSYGDV